MPAHGHATVWEILGGAGRVQDGKEWPQRLKGWWVAYKAARHEAQLAMLKAHWDAKREAVCALRAGAASDMVAPAHALSTAAALCDLAL